MVPTTLRVRARGTALVHRLEAMNSSPRQFVGRVWVEIDGKWGLKAVDEDCEIPFRAEYVSAVKSGELWAADQETASACGVPFDSTFGGQFAAAEENSQ